MIEIKKAHIDDAEILTQIQIESFEEHAKVWGSWTSSSDNKGPGGFDSVHHVLYSIKATNYYKITYNNEIIGGISVLASRKHGVIDKFFIHPKWKNKGVGSAVISLIEKEFPSIYTWELGTSSKSKQNHYFYEKVGYKKIGEDDDYFYFKKQKGNNNHKYSSVYKEQDISNSLFIENNMSSIEIEECSLEKADFSSVNLKQSTFTNSNISSVTFYDVNMKNSKFHNCNLNGTIFGDINLNQIEICQAAIGGSYIHDTNLGWHESYGPIKVERCILTNTIITECDLQGLQINNCKLEGMKINGILVVDLLKVYEELNKSVKK